jgi:hypothetical protein
MPFRCAAVARNALRIDIADGALMSAIILHTTPDDSLCGVVGDVLPGTAGSGVGNGGHGVFRCGTL